MKFKNLLLASIFSSVAILTSCGGGGSSDPSPVIATELTGQFIDSAVQGLRYTTSSGNSGVTDVNGRYNYIAGDSVEFFIGDISLGQASAATGVMTPISIVPGAVDETNTTVTNIARFLQSLDNDSDPSNGIVISANVATAAAGQSLDFTSVTFDTTASALLAMLRSNAGLAAGMLLSPAVAQANFKTTLLQTRAGFYVGSYTGVDTGTWAINVMPDGSVTGCADNSNLAMITGMIASSGSSTTVAGSTTTGAEFKGDFALTGVASGTWRNLDGSGGGTYSGNKTTVAPSCNGAMPPIAGGASDVITLGGDDAVALGGKLTITERAFRLGLTGADKTLISTSDGLLAVILSAIPGENVSPPATVPTNGVVINTIQVGTEIDISMRVNLNGKSYLYVCGAAFVTKCANITYDSTNRMITYNAATVEASNGNDATGLLTLTGTLSWMASNEK